MKRKQFKYAASYLFTPEDSTRLTDHKKPGKYDDHFSKVPGWLEATKTVTWILLSIGLAMTIAKNLT